MIKPLSNASFSFETYSPLGKKEISSKDTSVNQTSFLNHVLQSIPQAIEDSRTHENAVSLAAQHKISALDLLQSAKNAELSLKEAQVIIRESINAFKDIQQLPL